MKNTKKLKYVDEIYQSIRKMWGYDSYAEEIMDAFDEILDLAESKLKENQ